MGSALVDLFSWKFTMYPIDTPASAFGRLAPIVDLWRTKHTPSGGLPAWSDFELADFEGWWGKLALAEIADPPQDTKFILWGTQLAEWWRFDHTQRTIVEMSTLNEDSLADQVEYYRAINVGNVIGYNYGRIDDIFRPSAHALWIDLPLSRTHDAPTHIFSAAEVIDEDNVPLPDTAPD